MSETTTSSSLFYTVHSIILRLNVGCNVAWYSKFYLLYLKHFWTIGDLLLLIFMLTWNKNVQMLPFHEDWMPLAHYPNSKLTKRILIHNTYSRLWHSVQPLWRIGYPYMVNTLCIILLDSVRVHQQITFQRQRESGIQLCALATNHIVCLTACDYIPTVTVWVGTLRDRSRNIFLKLFLGTVILNITGSHIFYKSHQHVHRKGITFDARLFQVAAFKYCHGWVSAPA